MRFLHFVRDGPVCSSLRDKESSLGQQRAFLRIELEANQQQLQNLLLALASESDDQLSLASLKFFELRRSLSVYHVRDFTQIANSR
jgi:hypothetical protein